MYYRIREKFFRQNKERLFDSSYSSYTHSTNGLDEVSFGHVLLMDMMAQFYEIKLNPKVPHFWYKGPKEKMPEKDYKRARRKTYKFQKYVQEIFADPESDQHIKEVYEKRMRNMPPYDPKKAGYHYTITCDPDTYPWHDRPKALPLYITPKPGPDYETWKKNLLEYTPI